MLRRLSVITFLLTYGLSNGYPQSVTPELDGLQVTTDSTIIYDQQQLIVSYATIVNQYATIIKFNARNLAFYDTINHELYSLPRFENLSHKPRNTGNAAYATFQLDTVVLWPDSVVHCKYIFNTEYTLTKDDKTIKVKVDTRNVKWLQLLFLPDTKRWIKVTHRTGR